MGDLLGFGRDARERALALRDALDSVRSRADHPSGRAAVQPLPEVRWASQHPSSTEERRQNILAAKPRCKVCEVLFARNVRPPPDGLCMACRRDIARAAEDMPPEDPPLF